MAAVVRKCAVNSRLFQVILPRLYSTSSSGNNTGTSSSETKSKAKAEKPQKTKAATEPKIATPDPELLDNSQYRAAEYYQYNEMSFYDIDHEMATFRLPQQTKFKAESA